MSAYLINHLRIPNGVPSPDALSYLENVEATFKPFGGRWLVLDAQVEVGGQFLTIYMAVVANVSISGNAPKVRLRPGVDDDVPVLFIPRRGFIEPVHACSNFRTVDQGEY